MSESNQIQKIKFSSLLHSFENFGYKSSTKLGQNDFYQFLNKKSSTGSFDSLLCNKLFEVLNINSNSSIPIQEFIEGFLIFEEEVARNAESFRAKFLKEQEIYNKILKQCELYKAQNLNAEGFCKNAKISGEITDIDIKKKLEGLKEIIILVIFNNKKEELRFKIGSESSNIKKSFEFRPSSRKDLFEFVMKGVNEKNVEFDIGSKIFPLDEIASQEEYFVQIVVPEIDNPNQAAAFIDATILLYMSDYKYYEAMLRKQEKRMKKYKNAANKAAEYLKYVREIYGDLSLIKPDIVVDFNNEKLMQRKGAKLNVNFNNEIEAQVKGGNYYVQFNNEREIKKRGRPLRVEFNNSKEVITPVIETKKVEYSYKTSNYTTTNSVEKNIMNKTELNTQIMKNENLNVNENNTGSNILINSIQQVPEKIEEKIETKEEENLNHIPLYSDVIDSDENTNNNLQEQSQQIYTTKEQIITKQTQSSHNQFDSQSDLEKIFLAQQQQNTQITTENEQNGGEFDIDEYLKKQGYNINAQVQNNVTEDNTDYLAAFKNQQNSQNQQIDLQGYNFENMGDMNTATTTTTTTVQNTQNIGDINNINVNEYQVEAKTLEPIVKNVGVNFSVNKAIVNETTNKALVSENTLPVSYLPEKVNKLIVSEQVTTLPLIRTGSKVFYNANEGTGANINTNNYNNINYESNGTNSNNVAFDYNALIANNNGQNGQNGFIEGNNYNYDFNFGTSENNYQISNKWTTTTQKTTYNTTNVVQTSSSQYNPEINYQIEAQGIPVQQGEQIQYGF